MRKFVLLTVLVLLATTSVSANTITVTPTPVISGSNPYSWAYDVTLDGDSQINPGDFFTIFDFDGLVLGSQSANAGWTASSSAVGACPTDFGFPVLCAAADDPAIPNLTWTRTGSVIVSTGGVVPLGVFSAQSIYNIPRNDFFVSQDQDNQLNSPNEGAGGGTNVPSVPEPASLLLLGSGLALIARRKMVKK